VILQLSANALWDYYKEITMRIFLRAFLEVIGKCLPRLLEQSRRTPDRHATGGFSAVSPGSWAMGTKNMAHPVFGVMESQ
jgi:hypothetical protein